VPVAVKRRLEGQAFARASPPTDLGSQGRSLSRLFRPRGGCVATHFSINSSDFPGTIVAARSSHDQDRQRGELDFQTLVDQHYAPLFRFAMSLTRTEADAGDLVQDTFLTWAAKGHQLRDSTKVKTWLFTTLHRRFLETQRRATRFPHLELEEAEPELPSIEPEVVSSLDAHSVVELLARVDEQFQAAVALFYLEDYSYNEIAVILEVPLGTVKSRIARGLAQLKTLVLKCEPGTKKTEDQSS
jgi:RNA polymerase sigma-70 factor (ECF subfamily)